MIEIRIETIIIYTFNNEMHLLILIINYWFFTLLYFIHFVKVKKFLLTVNSFTDNYYHNKLTNFFHQALFHVTL